AALVVERARERFGRLDVLFNVAGGLSVIKPLAETAPDEWERELSRNARTTYLLCRAALPLLRESRGAIVNFASPAIFRPPARLAAYTAAKAAVAALTRSLAVEERGHGVRVNALAPGMIDTEQNRRSVPDPDRVRWVTREQVVRAALFLASEAASGITGETIQVLGEGIE
ncbi:MAG: SDR family oxidoreductase, partial [Gemmatimonadetes bacterium]|nr:SDR family oxidoreductase [Gemmatimonadota bacterium]